MTYINVTMTNKETGFAETVNVRAEDAHTALDIAIDEYGTAYEDFVAIDKDVMIKESNGGYVVSRDNGASWEDEYDETGTFRSINNSDARRFNKIYNGGMK